MQLASFLETLRGNGTLMVLATDPAAQFGSAARRLIGPELLPERPVSVNDYIEERISYRSLVANAGTRYSPAQKKGGAFVGSFAVHLAHQDIAAEFTSQEYDVLVRYLRGAASYQGNLLQSQPGMAAVVHLTNWLDTAVVRPLIDVLEMYRWQAIVTGVVTLTGDNAYNDTVEYPRFADLHAAAGGNWSDNAYDPMTDIFNRVTAMSARGVSPARFIIGRQALNKFLGNTNIRTRTGRVTVNTSGQIRGVAGAATLAEVNNMLAADGLPPFEVYDLMYHTELGAKHFLARDAMVIVGVTGQDETIDLGNAQFETVENTIGYTGVGIAVGQATPGRYIRAVAQENKPPRVEAEGWQTALPVITQPEAFSTITGIQ